MPLIKETAKKKVRERIGVAGSEEVAGIICIKYCPRFSCIHRRTV